MSPSNPDQWSFLVDEDMSRSLAPTLRTAGYPAEDVRDVGLSGKDDTLVFAYAQTHQQTLITEDMGFANIFQFRLGTHAGIVVGRFPNLMPTATVNQEILNGLATLSGLSLAGILIIIEPGRVRVRRLAP